MPMEWISLISLVLWQSSGVFWNLSAVKPAKAWPASWVSTFTSAWVPLKLEKIKGAWYRGREVQ